MRQIGWDVFLRGRWLDTVFYNERFDGGAVVTAEDVKKGLVEHDGYDSAIAVHRATRFG